MATLIGSIYESELSCIHFHEMAAEEVVALGGGFDVFLVNRRSEFDGHDCPLIKAIAEHTSGWVEVFGCNAKQIHDEIDFASFLIRKQAKVGDGNPMTTWNDENADSDISRYILTGGQGEGEKKVLIVIGDSSDEKSLLDLLKDNLRRNA